MIDWIKSLMSTTEKELPWITEGRKVFGLHEVKDKTKLSAWLKSGGKYLGDPSKLPWCFTGDAEVLTEDGWQKINNLTARQIYQVSDTGRLSLTSYNKVEKDYTGDLVSYKSKSLELSFDPEHRWWGSTGRLNGIKKFSKLEKSVIVVSPPFSGQSDTDVTDRELELLAATASDGTIRKDSVVFEVSRERKIKSLTALNPDKVYTQSRIYNTAVTKKPLTIFTFKNLSKLFSKFETGSKVLRKDFINSLSQDQARKFLLFYCKYDGSHNRFFLYTADKNQLDSLVMIAALAGWPVGVTTKKSSLKKGNIFYELHVSTTKVNRQLVPSKATRSHYSGKLFCVQVPEGKFVVKSAKGSFLVTGNCGDYTETAILKALPEEKLEGVVVENPFWALNWNTFGVTTLPVYGAIVTFKRPEGGHVGFLVGEDNLNWYVLGGNQGNTVSVVAIDKKRAQAFRWPKTYKNPNKPLPKLKPGSAPFSINEA